MDDRFHTFTVLINDISRCIHRIKTDAMAEFNLKSSHVSCLYYLYQAGTLTAKELSDICREDKANISRTIKYLESSGYLICRTQQQKRYQSPIGLTEAGRQVGERIARRIDAILCHMDEDISEEHRKIMYQSLAVVRKNLQVLCEHCTGRAEESDGSKECEV